MKRKVFSCFGLAVMLVVVYVAAFQRQYVIDRYIVETTSLSPESQSLQTALKLTNHGTFIYKASQPQVLDSDAFNSACKGVLHEHSIVLGCYAAQKIYIYDIQDQRLDGIKQVTAAHELLHAVYERMPTKERQELNRQLAATADSIDDQRFKDTLAEYRRAEPGQLENEIHSILGTEIAVLPTSLEQHYSKYFKNRKAVVSYSKQYEAAFTELDTQIKQFDLDLKNLKAKKDTLESSLKVQQAELQSMRSQLDQLRMLDDPQEYNRAVPAYNQRINEYNLDIATLKKVIEDYNAIVEKRNAVAATQNDLAKQLDSHYTPLE